MPRCYCFRGRKASTRKDRIPIGSRRPTTIPDSRCTEITAPPTTYGSRIGSATNVITNGGKGSTPCSRGGCRSKKSPTSESGGRFQRSTARTDGQLHLCGRHSFPRGGPAQSFRSRFRPRPGSGPPSTGPASEACTRCASVPTWLAWSFGRSRLGLTIMDVKRTVDVHVQRKVVEMERTIGLDKARGKLGQLAEEVRAGNEPWC